MKAHFGICLGLIRLLVHLGLCLGFVVFWRVFVGFVLV